MSTPKERIETYRDRTGAVVCKITGIVTVRVEVSGAVTIQRAGCEDIVVPPFYEEAKGEVSNEKN